jgi:indole-3-glycerol phosphate synthase
VLEEIIAHKREQVAAEKANTPPSVLESQASSNEPPRDFFAALTEHPRHESLAVIAEIKRRSPSAGLIRPEYDHPDFDPSAIAQQYSNAGASAISCLTDQKFFAGDPAYIHKIKDSVSLPVLRKDFIIDPYQITQARAIHADAVLLIAECLSDQQLAEFINHIDALSMTTLLEVHSESNLRRVLPIIESADSSRILLGINNRDLTKMETDLHHSIRLKPLVPDHLPLVTESGIRTSQELAILKAAGLNIALIGEHLMRTENPGHALSAMLDQSPS